VKKRQQLVKQLLAAYGRTFAEELGIRVETNRPSELFRLLILSLLLSARINHSIAMKSARVLFERGWTSPAKMARTTREERVAALDEGGYGRFDERTATMLGQTTQLLIEKYRGDLRKLREAAGADPERERRLLKEFKGIGDVGVDIFFREVQLVWPELFPFADKKVLASAEKLGLPPDARKLARLAPRRRSFVRLVSALIRVDLQRKQDAIRRAQARPA
jgi:endonuclease III